MRSFIRFAFKLALVACVAWYWPRESSEAVREVHTIERVYVDSPPAETVPGQQPDILSGGSPYPVLEVDFGLPVYATGGGSRGHRKVVQMSDGTTRTEADGSILHVGPTYAVLQDLGWLWFRPKPLPDLFAQADQQKEEKESGGVHGGGLPPSATEKAGAASQAVPEL